MLEILFLLLPIASVYGWFMGYKSAKKQQEDNQNKFSRDYMTGVNLLLSNQTNKAIDLFLNILQKQNNISVKGDSDIQTQFEAELTLGNLFLSRGEVDKAIRIHQNLDKSDAYSFDQKLLTKQQLAKDFTTIGFYDRAESLYILLVDEPDFAENALQQLAIIYQKTKEWEKAINVSKKLDYLFPKQNNISLAHYYCEQAENIVVKNPQQSESLLKLALQASPYCVRASILLAELAVTKLNYPLALSYLQNVLEQNPEYISEVILPIRYLYSELNLEDDFELFLIKASRIKPNSKIELALLDILEKKEGIATAQSRLYHQLKINPNPILFERFIDYQIIQEQDEKSQHSLELLQKMLKECIKYDLGYQCIQCGYQSHKLHWNCPSCQQWEKIKPICSLSHSPFLYKGDKYQ